MKKISESATTKTTISNKEKERKDMKRVEKNFNLAEEQKVFNVVISYDCDMKPLYEMLLSKCGKDMPTLVVLEKLPDEFIEIGYVFVSSPANQNKLILLLEKSDSTKMQAVLSEAIGAYQNKSSLKFESAYYPAVQFPDITHLAHNTFMYEHALKIASMLNVTCPQIIMKDSASMSEEGYVQIIKLDGKEIGRVIYLRKDGRIVQLDSLAHELRHCWQKEYTESKYFTDEINNQNSSEYLFQESEIDAEAYALKYVEKINGCSNVFQMLYGSNMNYKKKQYIRALRERMEEIKLVA